MSHTEVRERGVNVPPWVWALIVSLLIQVLGATFITGEVMARIDAMAGRLGRVENQIDRWSVKP